LTSPPRRRSTRSCETSPTGAGRSDDPPPTS
jgi:hypothetical protein